MYLLLGLSLALAALFSLHAMLAPLSMLLWRGLRHRAQTWSAAARANALFALRTLPGLLALLSVALFLLPAYVAREPRHEAEPVGVKLGLLAALSGAGLLLALGRGIAGWCATRRLLRNWQRHAEPIALPGVPIPAFRLRHPFPVIAVVGTLRPRLFLAAHLLAELGEEELAAALVHERGHLLARDNLKRGLLRFCRDVLLLPPVGRSLDRAWTEASELAADEYAARQGAGVALDLASALVKIARLVPAGGRPAIPASAHLIGENPDAISERVHRLLTLASAEPARVPAATRLRPALGLSLAALLFAAVTVAAFSSLDGIHRLIELTVSTLR